MLSELAKRIADTRVTPPFAMVDWDSPDAELLAAYEKARASMALQYAVMDINSLDPSLDHIEPEVIKAESRVTGNFATTVPGIVAQLLTHVRHIGCDIDPSEERALVERGFLAWRAARETLSSEVAGFSDVVHALLDFEWERRLAEYHEAAASFELIMGIKDRFDTRPGQRSTPPKWIDDMGDLIDKSVSHFSSEHQLQQLMRTLVPDQAALDLKIRIACDEQITDALPWIARDVSFLAGLTFKPGAHHSEQEAV